MERGSHVNKETSADAMMRMEGVRNEKRKILT